MQNKENEKHFLDKVAPDADAAVLAWHSEDGRIHNILAGNPIAFDILVSSIISMVEEEHGTPWRYQLDLVRRILEGAETVDEADDLEDMRS